MVTEICIVRHGETDWNTQRKFQGIEDTELNKNGEEQARLVANYLKKSQWDVIVSSPLKRAFNTAKIIGEKVGIDDIVVLDDFIERDFGEGSGLTPEQQREKFPDGVIPGKESDEALAKRANRGLEYIAKEYEGKRIILVSHGAMINSILKTVSENTINMKETHLKNTCLNIVKYENSKWNVELYNSVDYLNSYVDIAKNYYLGREQGQRMNCAQSVICAFKNELQIDKDIVEKFRSCGGGNAPDGLCGAYYAAKYILQNRCADEELPKLEEYFSSFSGSTKCREIREGRKLSCIGCIEKSSEFITNFIEKELRSSLSNRKD